MHVRKVHSHDDSEVSALNLRLCRDHGPSRPDGTRRRLAPAVACCATLLLLVGCSDAGQDAGQDASQEYVAAEVTQVYGRPDSARLEFSVGSCNGEPRFDVVETSTEIRVTATAQRPDPGGEGDCLDSVTVELQDSLGSRPVVDDATDAALPILPSES